jgi:RNA polymerase sigma factor (sigma-70 family)
MNLQMTSSPTPPAPVASSDASLLAAARHDPDAFRELYERYARSLNDYFVRRTASRTAWFIRARFRDRADGSAAPWIYGIAYNVLLMSIRRGSVEQRATERLGLQEWRNRLERLSDAVPETAWGDGADELLETLPSHQRDAVRLRVLDDLDHADVARELGTTPGTARVHVHRGLKALTRHLTLSEENHS